MSPRDLIERLHELVQACGREALREVFRQVVGAPDVSVCHDRPRSQWPRPGLASLSEVRP